ncbi:helix-turn-helix transcriptional regulator [Actinoplanes sp. NPDC026670]|uniref:helix-turn-helix domain-containing protein n=1 Tax=Actinoplanes sp. NPDC026670 TaxID=3154700 RepID=UPI00340152D8
MSARQPRQHDGSADREPESVSRGRRWGRSAPPPAGPLAALTNGGDQQIVLQLALPSDQELIYARARLLDQQAAAPELAKRLTEARLAAGKPPMRQIGKNVGYSVSTVSKVLAGKMPATWTMVHALAREFGVPDTLVNESWKPLWIAAESYRQRKEGSLEVKAQDQVAAPAGHACDRCGAWVIDTAKHVAWHMELEPSSPVETPLESVGNPADGDPWEPVRAELQGVLDPRQQR